MIMGTMMGALAEGLTLSHSADISPEILLQVRTVPCCILYGVRVRLRVICVCLFVSGVILCEKVHSGEYLGASVYGRRVCSKYNNCSLHLSRQKSLICSK